jgi:hypothetical protein
MFSSIFIILNILHIEPRDPNVAFLLKSQFVLVLQVRSGIHYFPCSVYEKEITVKDHIAIWTTPLSG